MVRFVSMIACLGRITFVPALAATLTFFVATPVAAKKYALLIGVSEYADLQPAAGSPAAKVGGRVLQPLKGPINDVALMATVLRENLGFKADDEITILVDKPVPGAVPSTGPLEKPTRANIIAALQRLREKAVNSDDFVVIYFSGHGVRMAEATPAGKECQQQDCNSEAFLPSNARLDADGQPVDFILDKELHDIFYGQTGGKGGFQAHVWAIFDSCHAGDITRGPNDGVILRSLDAVAFGIKGTAKAASQNQPSARDKPSLIEARPNGNIVVFAAAGPRAAAIETAIPKRKTHGADAPWHGVFTHLLAETLSELQPASYAALYDRLQLAYGAYDPKLPKPHVEGNLGKAFRGSTRPWVATSRNGEIRVDAGSLLGLNTGDIVAVQRDDQLQGYARVTHAMPMSAIIEPHHPEARPNAPRLPRELPAAGSNYTVKLESPIRFILTVAKPPNFDAAEWKIGREAIETLKDRVNFEWLEPGSKAKADIYLRFQDKGMVRFLTSTTETDGRTPPGVPLNDVKEAATAIESHLLANLAQRNLLAVARRATDRPFADGVDIGVWIYTKNRWLDGKRRTEDTACPNDLPDWDLPATKEASVKFEAMAGASLSHCDIVFLVIDNGSNRDIDVTCVYLDADGGIAAGFAGGMRERRRAGISSCPDGKRIKSKNTGKAFPLAIVTKCNPGFKPCGDRKDEMPVGQERLMVIAVEALEERRIDFDEINRPAAERTPPVSRGAPNSASRPELDALRNLLGSAVRPNTRSASFPSDAAVHFKTFTWTVAPPPK